MRARYRGTLSAVLLTAFLLLREDAHARTLVLVAESDRASTAVSAIVDGTRGDDVDVRFVAPSSLSDTLAASTSSHDAVIVIGRALLERRFTAPTDTAVLLGGFYGSIGEPSGTRSISLNVDPLYALEQVDKTGTAVTDVWTVVSPARSADADVIALDDLADRTAYVARARGERETARAWFDVLLDVRPPTEAIVVFDDAFLDTSGTWRFLIERAWRDEILVVSTIPSYSRRGVAIGFIPDLAAYGRLLARSARRMAEDPTFEPTRLLGADTTRRVFNQRTLEHVGRRLPADLDQLGRDDIVIAK